MSKDETSEKMSVGDPHQKYIGSVPLYTYRDDYDRGDSETIDRKCFPPVPYEKNWQAFVLVGCQERVAPVCRYLTNFGWVVRHTEEADDGEWLIFVRNPLHRSGGDE